jgi:hypothetical protein
MWLLLVDAVKVVDVMAGPEKSGPFLFPDASTPHSSSQGFERDWSGTEKNQSECYCGEREWKLVSTIAE